MTLRTGRWVVLWATTCITIGTAYLSPAAVAASPGDTVIPGGKMYTETGWDRVWEGGRWLRGVGHDDHDYSFARRALYHATVAALRGASKDSWDHWWIGVAGNSGGLGGKGWQLEPESSLFVIDRTAGPDDPPPAAVLRAIASYVERPYPRTLSNVPLNGFGDGYTSVAVGVCRGKLTAAGDRLSQCAYSQRTWSGGRPTRGCTVAATDALVPIGAGETKTVPVTGVVKCEGRSSIKVQAFGHASDGRLSFGDPNVEGTVTVQGLNAIDFPVQRVVPAGVPTDLELAVTVHAGENARGGETSASVVVVISPA